ncbi:MAG: hypothetical protein IT374_18790 [Polyangiaceae bacterium]|nr:hypothetical protein [Polyangiaceae bacterium]
MRRALWLSLLCVGCGKGSRAAPAPTPRASVSAAAAPRPSARPVTPPASAAPAVSAPPSRPVTTSRGFKLVVDKKGFDVATGSRAMLFRDGVVVRKRGGALLFAALGDKPGRIDDDGAAFARSRTAVARSDGASWAVWVEAGALVRARLPSDGAAPGEPETLARDAEEYPPAAAMVGGALAVAYVARRAGHDDDRRAKLWVEGRSIVALSGDSGASALSLLARDGARLLAAWIDQRTALAPVHVAEIDLSQAETRVGAPSVAWNAPPADGLLELAVSPQQPAPIALVAGPKNGAEFGLARVPLSPGARPRDDASWLDYPNGLDPAPVVAVSTCGRPAAVFVRPVTRAPDAPRSIVHAWVGATGELLDEVEIARAGRVDHLDALALATGAWVLYSGDGRTQLRRVRCAP